MTALAEAVLRAEVAAQIGWTQADPALCRRYGFTLAWRAGVACFAARRPLFGDELTFGHRAVGFGVFAPATTGVLDRIRRHYASLGAPCRIHVAEGATPLTAERALVRSGFVREERAFDLHLLRVARAPHLAPVEGLEVRRVKGPEIERFSSLVRDAFGDTGESGEYFRRTRIRLLRDHPRSAVAVMATVGGEPAGTGLVIFARGFGSLYGGAVLERFRGRGIQKAVVAERVRIGLARRVRLFVSQTVPDSPSAHNLAECGFRVAWRMAHWVRPAE